MFWRLIGDIDDHLLPHLLDYENLLRTMYIFSMETRSVRHPYSGEIPFPVLLTLGCYSKRHIFQNKSLPSSKAVGQAIQDLSTKIKWAYTIGDDSRAPWWRKCIGVGVRAFSGQIPPGELGTFITCIRSTIYGKIKKLHSEQRVQRKTPTKVTLCDLPNDGLEKDTFWQSQQINREDSAWCDQWIWKFWPRNR